MADKVRRDDAMQCLAWLAVQDGNFGATEVVGDYIAQLEETIHESNRVHQGA